MFVLMCMMHVLKFSGPGKMACNRGTDTRMLSQIQSEPGGKDAGLWNKWCQGGHRKSASIVVM